MAVKTYRDLIVWQEAMGLAEDAYRATHAFPKHELYGLTSQIRRAVVSVASNIAEGQSRDTTRDFLKFLSISLGSLAEFETQMLLANRLGYVSDEVLTQIEQRFVRLGRQLRSLQSKLRRRLNDS